MPKTLELETDWIRTTEAARLLRVTLPTLRKNLARMPAGVCIKLPSGAVRIHRALLIESLRTVPT